jgi:hypothetical protein
MLQFGPAATIGWLHFVVSLPAELNGIAVAGGMNGAREAIEGEFAAVLIEQDVSARHSHIVTWPSAPDAHAGGARSLGSRSNFSGAIEGRPKSL